MSTPTTSYTNTVDPTANDGGAPYNKGDIWLNTTTGKFFQCKDPTAGSAKWVTENFLWNVRDFGAQGASGDDTTAINSAINNAKLYGGTVYVPTGVYGISDGKATSNIQKLSVTGATNSGSITLTVATNTITFTTNPITYVGLNPTTAQLIQNELNSSCIASVGIGERHRRR